MGIRSINCMTPQCAPAFCRCYSRLRAGEQHQASNFYAPEPECRCGESEAPRLDWTWDAGAMRHPATHFDGESVVFHPLSSRGTSVVRGNRPFERNQIHFWEVKITSFMSGTDLMIGCGTDAVDIKSHQLRFASFLGLDDQSWGFSYRGQIQHANRMKYYGRKFSRGCLVGVYLDRQLGVLQFYVNRRPQGVAYTNLPADAIIYPFVCSTSAKSSLKLINATSIPKTLQYQCMHTLARDPSMVKTIKTIPGFAALYKATWFLRCKEKFAYQHAASAGDTTTATTTKKPRTLSDVLGSTAAAGTDEAIDDLVRAMPDIDDIYADCETDYYLEAVDASKVQRFDEEETASFLTDDTMIGGVHFLL